MRHHLRARVDKIKLRVLHPGISAHRTVDILRGVPEGSRLSPTLFGIFVADLVHELTAKFPEVIYLRHQPPNPHTLRPGSTAHICIGGLLYVDELTLMSTSPRELQSMSTCPRELQSMLNACQHWSIRNRMQINTGKTKIMACFEFETPVLLRAWGDQHQPSPTMPLFSRVLTLSNLRPPLVPYPPSLVPYPNLSTLALFWILNSLCTSQLWKPYAVLPSVKLLL